MGRRSVLAALAFAAWLAPAAGWAQTPRLALTRLDCGSVEVPDVDFLNDTYAFEGRSRTVTVSCYLIRHGDRYMLWDTGLPLSRLGAGQRSVGGGQARLERSLVDLLAERGLTATDVAFVGLSHYHADHAGQAASFPTARLLIGAEDWALVRGAEPAFNLDRSQFAAFTSASVEAVAGDRDVFGDGSVVMLATPGHTPGHHSLLVRLPSGPVLLTGDLWHFAEQIPINGVPRVNTSRADTLASMDRLRRIATNLNARIVIGHDPRHIHPAP